MAGYTNNEPGTPTLLGVNTAVNFAAGVPGTAGKAADTILTGIKIRANAGPATLTINSGFRDHTNTQDTTHYVFTGSTTVDSWWPLNWLNTAGPLQVTASVANVCIVETIAAAKGP